MAETNLLPLISVIVPVYNVAEYLPECIDSIISQTYTNLEIILVDDGSTDECPRICDEYAKKDSRIRVIHKENGGLSDARNAGLDICTGEWIGFVDSDDYIDKTMYSKLYKAAAENTSDVSVCHFVDSGNGKYHQKKLSSKMVFDLKEDMVHHVLTEGDGTISACLKLYKSSVFYGLRFPKRITYEDMYIILLVIKNTFRMTIIPDNLYFYRKRTGSIVKATIWNEHVWDNIFVCKHNLIILKKEYPRQIDDGIRFLCKAYRDCMMRASCTNDMKEHIDDMKIIRQEFRDWSIDFLKNPVIGFKAKVDTVLLSCLPISCYIL